MLNNRELGTIGENIAVKYLNKNGYQIIERNFRKRYGEIDIIAKDKDYTVFIEVKLRRSVKYGYPGEAVNLYKQNKIKKIAEVYLYENNGYDYKIRFDVIEIIMDKDNNIQSINLIKNAFN